jgi:hypothetical protein
MENYLASEKDGEYYMISGRETSGDRKRSKKKAQRGTLRLNHNHQRRMEEY